MMTSQYVTIVTSSVHRAQSICVLFFPPVTHHKSQVTNNIRMKNCVNLAS